MYTHSLGVSFHFHGILYHLYIYKPKYMLIAFILTWTRIVYFIIYKICPFRCQIVISLFTWPKFNSWFQFPTFLIWGIDTIIKSLVQATDLEVILTHLLFSNFMSSNPVNSTFNIYPKFDYLHLLLQDVACTWTITKEPDSLVSHLDQCSSLLENLSTFAASEFIVNMVARLIF